tara:strand:- start:1529 stop:2794 length:1266 start_codon:yes stop_codon:yes gene_type:complete
MESFEFIESGLILNLNSLENLKKFKHVTSDFAKHSDAYKFLTEYVDTYGEFPSSDLLVENFPTLDTSARDLNLDFALDKFKQQVLFRQIVTVFQSNKELLRENPKKAFASILTNLNDVGIVYDEDITHYDDKSLARLKEWEERKERRLREGGLMGIKTPFKSINNTGVGWMPGDLIAIFARPTVGKTWMCADMAATAALSGVKTLFVSTEMPTKSISMRLDVIMANKLGYKLSHRALRHGEDLDVEQYTAFLKELDDKNLLICDHISGQSSISIESITALVRKHNPSFIVLDGIYLVSTGLSKSATWEQSHALFYAMKNLCLSQNISMCVSTQANRDASDMYEPPSASSVAFGDALIRAADVALSMCRTVDQDGDPDERVRRVQIQKIRDSELSIGDMYLKWEVNSGAIEEIENYELSTDY